MSREPAVSGQGSGLTPPRNIEEQKINFTYAQLATIAGGILAGISAIGAAIFFIARLSFAVEDLKERSEESKVAIKKIETDARELKDLIEKKYASLENCCKEKPGVGR